MTTLVRVAARHFTAGVEVSDGGVIVRAAPILHWARGKNIGELVSYCVRKGWDIRRVEEDPPCSC